MTRFDHITEILGNLKASHNFRTVPSTPPHTLLDLSSNDYLGLASDNSLQMEFMARESNRMIPFTSSASRLLAHRQDEYKGLEELLASLYGHSRRALLFNSGYHANTGLISAIASAPSTLIVADKLVHASIIDGIMLAKAPFERFVHNSMERLERIIAKNHNHFDTILVITESVFSMDGDQAPLAELAELKKRYLKIMLYVDEAHSFACCGKDGLGLCHDLDDFDAFDIVVGTFGKAAASAGAFAVMSDEMRDFAVNRARSFIFSTSLPPINIAWSRFIVERLASMQPLRDHLRNLAMLLNRRLTDEGVAAPPHAGHICPIMAGSAEKALSMSASLAAEGFKVLPIRTPTVPPGTERLRVSLSAALTTDDIKRFVSATKRVL